MTKLDDTTLSMILDVAPEAILVADADGQVVMANRKAEILFGCNQSELIACTITTLIPTTVASSRGATKGTLLSAQRYDGEPFLAEVTESALHVDGLPLVVMIAREVSSRSDLEAELVNAEYEKTIAERIRLEAEAARVKAEDEKTIAERTRLVAEAARVKAEGEKTIAERVRLEAEAARVNADHEKSIAEGVRLEAESTRVKAEGEKTIAERKRLEAEAARVTAEGEKTIAERVRLEAEAALNKAEAMRTIAERVRLDAEAARVKAEGEKTVAERVRLEAETARVAADHEKSIAEKVRLEAEAARIKADHEKTVAERVRLEAEVQRIKAEAEKAEAERVRLEAEVELERLKGLLHQSQRMESLGQLAGGVAHDFNNLLAVILNYASFVAEELEKSAATPEGVQWRGTLSDVQQIQLAAERASVLTHQLLAFARREVIQSRSLSFNEAVRNIEEMLRRTIGEQIELNIDLEPNLMHVMADPGHIEQIILNLSINARDAMPLGGTLSIVTSSRDITDAEWSLFGAPAGSYVCVQFSDNGTGMSPETCDRAFEPFFTTKPRGEGSGLGLATVYGIVLQSGGFTKIYSDEGIGTCITILLPVDPDSAQTSSLDADAVSKETLEGSETILVVDDEEGLREVTRRILSRSGYTVLTASNGADAIQIATERSDIDLLLTDVIMGKMQGPTVAKEVLALRPDVRVLFMSGHAQPVLEAEAVLGTDFQLVEKPFDQKMLLSRVRLVLDAVDEGLLSKH